jgi:chorismate synthase
MMGINAAKGVEIGDGFALTALNGAQAQDAILAAEDGRLTRPTNHCGGLEGGITNGQPIIVRVGFKPIATTHQPQPSVDLAAGVAAHTIYERSDTCPIPRAVPMVESLLAFTLADALQEKLGGDSLTEQQARCAALRQPRLDELRLSGQPHRFWPE